jgi:oxygen-dependent protoporphyrinogen oxidase
VNAAGAPAGAAVPRRLRVVVVGAGIAGLSCARRLADLSRQSGASLDLTVLEASGRTGGVILTERAGGFLIEGGPDCFITEKPWALDLCRRLGLESALIGTNPDCRRSFVLRGRRLLPIPDGYQLMAPGRILPFARTPILSLRGKLRAALDLALPRGPEAADESLASFVTRRFGREVLERLAQPLLAGIYNADPERLSLRATMPRFLEMERAHRSVILALLSARRRRGAHVGASRSGAGVSGTDAGVSGARYSLFVTLRDGLTNLVERLGESLPPGALRTGVRTREVVRAANGWTVASSSGETLAADAVVLAMPANASAPLLRAADPELGGLLASIPYGTSATVTFGYRRQDLPRLPQGFGVVVPRLEGLSLIACSFSSVKFSGRAPEEHVLLRSFLGGPAAEGADHARLEDTVRRDLGRVLGINAEPVITRTCVWPRAMAQYEVGHLERVAAIERRLAALPGLALAGNGLRGVGIPDCVRSGEAAAQRLAAYAGWYAGAPGTD